MGVSMDDKQRSEAQILEAMLDNTFAIRDRIDIPMIADYVNDEIIRMQEKYLGLTGHYYDSKPRDPQ